MEKAQSKSPAGGISVTRRAGLLLPIAAAALFGARASAEEQPELLFVQSAPDMEADGSTLRLKGANPLTLFFSDRPERIAGHYKLDEWGKLWTEGKDIFLKDHPNAVLSVFEPEAENATDSVIELVGYKAEGLDLMYQIKLIKGALPKKGGQCSLFIDIIGMPRTPLSYAGVARSCPSHRISNWCILEKAKRPAVNQATGPDSRGDQMAGTAGKTQLAMSGGCST